jgi:hypothetical protein
VEYFFYCRGRPGTEALLEELAEAHWSFMDGYAEAMASGSWPRDCGLDSTPTRLVGAPGISFCVYIGDRFVGSSS